MALENNQSIGPKIGALAKMKGHTQSDIAQACNISRVSVNRFFTGKTSLKSRELTQLLIHLGIDLERQVDNLIQFNGGEKKQPMNTDVEMDVITVISHLEKSVKRTVLEQIAWWGNLSNQTALTHPSQRIKAYVGAMRD